MTPTDRNLKEAEEIEGIYGKKIADIINTYVKQAPLIKNIAFDKVLGLIAEARDEGYAEGKAEGFRMGCDIAMSEMLDMRGEARRKGAKKVVDSIKSFAPCGGGFPCNYYGELLQHVQRAAAEFEPPN
jgi:hypothetical protein